MRKFSSVSEIVDDIPPDQPLHIYREHTLEKAAGFFVNRFKGKVLYAVKTNPQEHILQKIYKSGITSFDVASLAEIEAVKTLLPDAELFFMHTVKSRAAIKKAYYEYGVRSFSLDTVEELEKILSETNFAKDLNLFIRLAIPNTYSEITLADKFGVNSKEAPALIKKARQYSKKLGVCFHVGSQCMHPDAYRIALRTTKTVIAKSGVQVDCVDVGGGFPSIYPGMIPPALETFFTAIDEEFKKFKDNKNIELMCEPGRAIVAESGSVLVKVELRKDSFLYINDGTYGSLFDAGTPHFIFPVKLIRPDGKQYAENLLPFSFFGPTCDTLDFMKGPFYLPEDIQEGDYIEIGQLGAYGRTLATEFNGFKPAQETIIVEDEPLMTVYEDVSISKKPELMVMAA